MGEKGLVDVFSLFLGEYLNGIAFNSCSEAFVDDIGWHFCLEGAFPYEEDEVMKQGFISF